MNPSTPSVFVSDRQRLATLLDVEPDTGNAHLWKADELGAILRHQLATPIQADLARFQSELASKAQAVTESHGHAVETFGALFADPAPPLALLKLCKDFAKACRTAPGEFVPREIASVLYFACIAAALVRCHRRITSLSSQILADGFRWVSGRPWVETPLRSLVEEGLNHLRNEN